MAALRSPSTLGLVDAEPQAARRSAVAARWREGLRLFVLYFLCGLVTLLCVFPFLWMLKTSFVPLSESIKYPPSFWPQPFILDNYPGLFKNLTTFPFHKFIFNSVYISVVVTIGRVFFSALAGYAFARMRFRGSNLTFSILILAFLMPPVMLIIPLYTMYNYIGWIDTHWPLLVPGVLSTSFGTFLMRQFFKTIPVELEEAARIDGATRLGIFWMIMVPLSLPGLAALAIFSFQGIWNDFYTPFIFINTLDKQTLQVGLRAFTLSSGMAENNDYPSIMAGGILALLPVLTLYFSLQRYFVQGIALTGIKG